MDESMTNQTETEKLQSLTRLTRIVYLCHVLSFIFAGLPLLIAVAINFMRLDDVQGTWLQSHFDWQVRTVWMALAGFALSGLTFHTGGGIFILFITVGLMIYRIALGWNALKAGQPIRE
ncbi:MAG: hypothetical protein ISR72_10675 [Methylobacter sp.]|nr:hypothetical protein [Methylobacter sp.]